MLLLQTAKGSKTPRTAFKGPGPSVNQNPSSNLRSKRLPGLPPLVRPSGTQSSLSGLVTRKEKPYQKWKLPELQHFDRCRTVSPLPSIPRNPKHESNPCHLARLRPFGEQRKGHELKRFWETPLNRDLVGKKADREYLNRCRNRLDIKQNAIKNKSLFLHPSLLFAK